MVVVRMMNGELYEVSYNREGENQISSIKKQLYDQLIGKHGRNELIRLFRLPSNDEKENKYDEKDEKEKDEKEKELNDMDLLEDDEMICGIIDIERKMKQSETLTVEDKLSTHLNGKLDAFRDAVKTANALVAGGSILAAFGDYPINDLDIYVHHSKAKTFLDDLSSKCGYSLRQYGSFHQASQYDRSFFRKNKILARFCLWQGRRRHNHEKSMDVMIIPDDYSIENVVTNFDLSFCETWWDGKDVYANDPYGVRTKSGILKPDYRKSLLEEMNRFIVARLAKYRSRGFTIDLCVREYMQEHGNEVVLTPASHTHRPTPDSQEWAISTFLSYITELLTSYCRFVFNQRSDEMMALLYDDLHKIIYFRFFPTTFSMENLETKMSREVIDFLSAEFYHTYIAEMPDIYKEMYREIFGLMDIQPADNTDSGKRKRQTLYLKCLDELTNDLDMSRLSAVGEDQKAHRVMDWIRQLQYRDPNLYMVLHEGPPENAADNEEHRHMMMYMNAINDAYRYADVEVEIVENDPIEEDE